jgi:hypothetical protein
MSLAPIHSSDYSTPPFECYAVLTVFTFGLIKLEAWYSEILDLFRAAVLDGATFSLSAKGLSNFAAVQSTNLVRRPLTRIKNRILKEIQVRGPRLSWLNYLLHLLASSLPLR